MKKITLRTVKSFIKNNRENLLIKVKSEFDGMTDGIENKKNPQFVPVEEDVRTAQHSLGIEGAWFVFDSRDHFSEHNTDTHQGIEVYNCCGSFILAVKK